MSFGQGLTAERLIADVCSIMVFTGIKLVDHFIGIESNE